MKMSQKIIKKVAVFEYVAGGDMSCMTGVQFATDHNRTDANVMRITEWQDVEFTARKTTTQDSLELIDQSTRKCYEEVGLIRAKLMELRKQRKELNLLSGEVL